MIEQYSSFEQINKNIFLSNLTKIAYSKGLQVAIIDCGNYSFETPNGGLWLVFGLSKDKVCDSFLANNITNVINSRNENLYFYLDVNLIQITGNNPLLVFSKFNETANLLRFLTQCFQDSRKPIPDKILLSDAKAILAYYNVAQQNNNANSYTKNIKSMEMFVRKSDTTINPLHTNKEKANITNPPYYYIGMNKLRRFFINTFKKHKNHVRAQDLFRCATDISSYNIPKYAINSIKQELYNLPDVLFYISPASYENYISRVPYAKVNKKDKVYSLMYSKADEHIIYDIIIRNTKPEAKQHTYTELAERYKKLNIFVCPHSIYNELKAVFIINNVPFFIDTQQGSPNDNFFRIVYPNIYSPVVSNFITTLPDKAFNENIHKSDAPVNCSFVSKLAHNQTASILNNKKTKGITAINSFEARNNEKIKASHIEYSLNNLSSFW